MTTNSAEMFFKETQHLVDTWFVDKATGKSYAYVGVTVGADDYYYTMYSKENGMQMLSCVGSIEGHGFYPIPETSSTPSKKNLDFVLAALVGPSLVEQWWSSPNKHWNGRTPLSVYEESDVGKREVEDYVLGYAYGR